ATVYSAGDDARVDLLRARAAAGDCDLVVKGAARGWLLVAGGLFVADRAADAPVPDATLRALAATPGQELTFTCVPPGSGTRVGRDRDEDGFLDRAEMDAGTDPADAASHPSGAPLPIRQVLVGTRALGLAGRGARTKFAFDATTRKDAAANRITPPPAD